MKEDDRFFNRALNLHWLVIFSFVSLLFIIPANSVYAHKVYLFAWTEGDTIHTESYSGDKKIKEGLIRVYDNSGNLLLEGRTDAGGNFSFKNPQKTGLKIVIEAGMGHRAEYVFENGDNETTTGPAESVESHIHASPVGKLDKEEIKKIMEEVIDNKLNPISKRLAKIEENRAPGLTEIIGGIGYILGIMGVALYFKNRTRQKH